MKDKFTAEGVQKRLSKRVDMEVFECLDSTNTVAKKRIFEGCDQWHTVVALSQTGGEGRLGRSFFSPLGAGIYMSIVLYPDLERLGLITGTAAVAVCEALEKFGISPAIKWVNDIFVDGKKVCGILTEAVSTGEGTHVIVGIGINLDTVDFPSELKGIATSLDARIDAVELIAKIYGEIFFFLQTPNDREWLNDYREHSCVIGRRVAWTEAQITRTGVAEAIDKDGALLVRDEENNLVRLHTGEISLRPLE